MMSRAMMISSAAAGMPGMPNRRETSPSCMAPVAIALSSQWTMTGRSIRAETSSAWRMMALLAVVSPSSDQPIAPASITASKSTGSSPSRPRVMVAMGYTRTEP